MFGIGTGAQGTTLNDQERELLQGRAGDVALQPVLVRPTKHRSLESRPTSLPCCARRGLRLAFASDRVQPVAAQSARVKWLCRGHDRIVDSLLVSSIACLPF